MNNRTTRHHRFVETFVDFVTVRPFFDDLNRLRRAANLPSTADLLELQVDREGRDLRAA